MSNIITWQVTAHKQLLKNGILVNLNSTLELTNIAHSLNELDILRTNAKKLLSMQLDDKTIKTLQEFINNDY